MMSADQRGMNQTTAEAIVRAKLADGQTIYTPDVMGLLDEIDRLRAEIATLEDDLFEARSDASGVRMLLEERDAN